MEPSKGSNVPILIQKINKDFIPSESPPMVSFHVTDFMPVTANVNRVEKDSIIVRGNLPIGR